MAIGFAKWAIEALSLSTGGRPPARTILPVAESDTFEARACDAESASITT
jgi:hypothetical protein